DLLDRVRTASLTAFDHQELPFEKLVAECAPSREAGVNPIFQLVFNQIDGSAPPPEGGGVRFGPMRGLSQTTRLDIEVHAIDAGDDLRVDIVYSTDLFDAVSIRRLLAHYEHVLAAVVDAPERAIEDV